MQIVIDVLVIDSSDSTARTTLAGIRQASETARVLLLKDGAQALQYIYRTGTFKDRSTTLPRMILLDIDVPVVNGLLILDRLRGDPDTHHIPVIVFTSNRNSVPIEDAYARGAKAYALKPDDKAQHMAEVARLVEHWLTNPPRA